MTSKSRKALLELRVCSSLLLSDAKHLKQHIDIVTNMWLENSLSREIAKEALVYLEHIEKCINTIRRALNALFEEEKASV